MTANEKKTNYIISTIRDSDLTSREELINVFSQIICQFDTDVAIAVMEGIGEKDEALAIKVNYGY